MVKMSIPIQESNTEEREDILFANFLETNPPGTNRIITDLFTLSQYNVRVISRPELQLSCNFESCNGIRFFVCLTNEQPVRLGSESSIPTFLNYRCRNCRTTEKLFALLLYAEGEGHEGIAHKIGEYPSFGPPIPSRVISLIGPDREIFIRGRRSEIQGLGIGAFAYYRRVVENQKSRLITEMAKVAERLGAKREVLAAFSRAAAETQFSKAIDDIKDAIPQTLLINGHNPLTLLHKALSEGLHAQPDEECLEIATSIRVVMTELAESISLALKDEAELKQAVNRLLNRSSATTKGEDSEEHKET